ncbi:MAG: VWA domain-containing protein [Planctomycetota bacterium]|nr:VWA domain-containing protein [Planctomycetota bacterium]
MARTTRLPALLLIAAGLLLPAGVADAELPEWRPLESEFKKGFKPDKSGLQTRSGLVKKLARSKDGRAVKLLMDALKRQRRHAADLLAAYDEGMQAWQEKTSRLERQREERVRKHRERYEKKGEKPPPFSVNLNSEEGKWLGALPKHPGEMIKARERLMQRYDRAMQEHDLVRAVKMAAIRVLRDVKGEEFDKAVKELLRVAARGKGPEQAELVATLGYVRGDAVTDILIKHAESRDPHLQHAALEALGRQNSERGKDVLLRALENESWQVRSSALDGLVFYRDVAVMDALLARAAKEEGVVRRRIFQTMSAIVGETVKAVLEAWQSWWPSNRDDVIARWKRIPREGPVLDDPPRMPVKTEANADSTSFYGIRTDSKHIIFVADISGSMRRTDDDPKDKPAKIDVCRDELKKAIRGLSARDEDERGAASFNVVLFSTDVLVYKPGKMVVATKKNKEKVYDWIDKHVQADMQTNIYDAMVQAFNIISGTSASKNRDKGADTVFLMTDGAPSRGKFIRPGVILREVNKMNKSRGITIHTIGVGENHNKGFLERLATDNGGQYLAR